LEDAIQWPSSIWVANRGEKWGKDRQHHEENEEWSNGGEMKLDFAYLHVDIAKLEFAGLMDVRF